MTLGAVGSQRQSQSQQLCPEEQRTVDQDAAASVTCELDVDLGRNMGEKMNEQPTRNVVPMDKPSVFNRDGIGEYRPIPKQVQVVAQPDSDEQQRP